MTHFEVNHACLARNTYVGHRRATPPVLVVNLLRNVGRNVEGSMGRPTSGLVHSQRKSKKHAKHLPVRPVSSVIIFHLCVGVMKISKIGPLIRRLKVENFPKVSEPR